jgi:hypothetical protein
VEQVFGNRADTNIDELTGLEFPLRGTTTVAEIEDMCGVTMGTGRDLTLSEMLQQKLGTEVAPGHLARFGPIGLRVRRVAADMTVEQVGMTIFPDVEDVTLQRDDNARGS